MKSTVFGNVGLTIVKHFDKNLKPNLFLLNTSSIIGAGTIDELEMNYGVKNSDKSSNTIRRDMTNNNQRKLNYFNGDIYDSNINWLIANSIKKTL